VQFCGNGSGPGSAGGAKTERQTTAYGVELWSFGDFDKLLQVGETQFDDKQRFGAIEGSAAGVAEAGSAAVGSTG
jgi:hypothetical protein